MKGFYMETFWGEIFRKSVYDVTFVQKIHSNPIFQESW